MPRATPPITMTPPRHGAYTYKANADGMTHSAEYEVQYGSRKLHVSARRVLLPAPKGKRRTQSELRVEGYRRDRSYNRHAVELPPAVHAEVLEHFRGLVEGSKPSANAKRVTMRQIGGDDGYCWAVMVDGVPKWEGMQRGEASSRRTAEIARLDAGERGPADVCNDAELSRLARNLRETVQDNGISSAKAVATLRAAHARLQQSA